MIGLLFATVNVSRDIVNYVDRRAVVVERVWRYISRQLAVSRGQCKLHVLNSDIIINF
jgi:hypothetical protein